MTDIPLLVPANPGAVVRTDTHGLCKFGLYLLPDQPVITCTGCRQGQCGTCATKLLRGNVRMDNERALTEEMRAQGVILPCVSHPLSDVTLDAL